MGFDIAEETDRYFATLSKLFAKRNQTDLREIIVNAQIKVDEACYQHYDEWNQEVRYGHALHLIVPVELYPGSPKQKKKFEDQIMDGINEIYNARNEHIAKVFLEMEGPGEQDWRKESGLLLTGERTVLPEDEKRIWASEHGYKVFLSHKADFKAEVAKLKEMLAFWGVSCFVAHEDINPTLEWQHEIETALFSMDAFVPLLTKRFHDSLWTDQEIGVALGRGVPIVPVKIEIDPYGFIGKYQALCCSWDTAAEEIVRILAREYRMLNAYINVVRNCDSFDAENTLSKILPSINKMSFQQADLLASAFRENSQLRGSYGFNGDKQNYYGEGLKFHLKRLTGKLYEI